MKLIESGKYETTHPWGHYYITSGPQSIQIENGEEISLGRGVYFFHYIDGEIDHFCFFDSIKTGWKGFDVIKKEVHSDYCPLCNPSLAETYGYDDPVTHAMTYEDELEFIDEYDPKEDIPF